MVRRKSRVTVMSALLTMVAGMTVFAAGSAEATKAASTAEFLEVRLYNPASPPADFELVMGELNKLIKKDFNAKLTITYIPWSDWNTKYPLLLASGDDFEMIFTSSWAFYDEMCEKEAFLALDDLLPVYAPVSWQEFPKEAWEFNRRNGKICKFPQNFEIYSTFGLEWRDDLRKKYGLQELKTFADLEVFMDKVKQNETDMLPFDIGVKDYGFVWGFTGYSDAKLVSDYGTLSSLNLKFLGKQFHDLRSIDLYTDLPGLLETVKIFHRWNQKGFWSKNVLSSTSVSRNQFKVGKTAVASVNTKYFNLDRAEITKTHPQWDPRFMQCAKNRNYTWKTAFDDGIAFNANAANPERAMMILDKLHHDKTYFMLTHYGIEGRHYTLDANNRYVVPDSITGPHPFPIDSLIPWGWRETKYYLDPAQVHQDYLDTNAIHAKTAIYEPLTGFSLDRSSIDAEIVACNQVAEQYGYAAIMGLYNTPEEGIRLFREKLVSAGAEKVLAEVRKQVSAWLASK